MRGRSTADDKVQSLIAGATGGAALYHYSTSLGLGLDKEIVGHLAPVASFLLGWLWVVIYQETFGRFNLYRLKKACARRIAEINKELEEGVSEERKRKLLKERDDCNDVISQASSYDIKRRFDFSVSR